MNDALRNSRFLKAARQEPVDTTPIWIMRQAGRYLPEYMAVRNRVTFIELCKTPELACEVTVTAQRVLGVDAAILFADLLPMLEPMGMQLEYVKGEGPVLHNPILDASHVERLTPLEHSQPVQFVFDAVKLIRNELPADIPLLGFAGLPFTLASYCIEGGSSRSYVRTKSLMYRDPGAWNRLMTTLAESVGRYLNWQIDAGCQAVQVFDSWAGCLSPADYQRYVFPYTKQVIDAVDGRVPVINFLTGNPALIGSQAEAGGDVIGVDWRIDLADAWNIVGADRAIQGNLEPVVLFADIPEIQKRAEDVLRAAAGRPGHIFNLGHGVMPDMKPDHVRALVDYVHERGVVRP